MVTTDLQPAGVSVPIGVFEGQMTAFNFADAKVKIAEIVEIVKTVPETLQEVCFEMLFEAAFASGRPDPQAEAAMQPAAPAAQAEIKVDPAPGSKKLPSNILAFIRKHDVSVDALGKLFMLEHDPLLPIYKVPAGNTSKAQLVKVMMVLLENGLLNNSLSAAYADLRESVKEDGLFDGNFNKMLKRYNALFKGAISADSIAEEGTVELTGAGMEKLAEAVKELTQ